MSAFVYHRKAENFLGSHILPLNALGAKYPELQANHLKKYKGREKLLNMTITGFNNHKFGDFSHFLLIDPQVWLKTVKEYGLLDQDKTFEFFKISFTQFSEEYTRVFRYTPEYKAPFDPLESLSEYLENPVTGVPDYTKKYYEEVQAGEDRFIFYHLLPHLITTQAVEVDNCEIIELK